MIAAQPPTAVRRAHFGLCLGAAFLLSACGSRGTMMPSPAQLSGEWRGEDTVTSLTGGECLGAALQDLVGFPRQFRGTLTQSGINLTAALTIDHTGGVCTYSGVVDGTALDLTATGCTPAQTLGIECPNGMFRDILPKSATLHAIVRDNSIEGAAVEVDSVVATGTTDSVGELRFTTSFTLVRE